MSGLRRALTVPLLAIALTVLAFQAPLPWYTEHPGALFTLGDRVEVAAAEPLHGELLFATVNVRSATFVSAVRAMLDTRSGLLPRERLIPPGLDQDAFFEQQRAEFQLAADVAAAHGLRAAGLPADPHDLRGEGALVLRVLGGSPADGALRPGDVIVAVEEVAVGSAAAFQAAVRRTGSAPVALAVRRDGAARSVTLAPRPPRHGAAPDLGVVASTFRPTLDLPIPVRVEAGPVGGPSAGLAVALAVYDLAAEEDLLRGRRVAATGSLDADGAVGRIGGVRMKALAAHDAGVDVFLVPAAQFEAARRGLPRGSPVRLVPVETFTGALAALRAGPG